jgi:hypothetical protein
MRLRIRNTAEMIFEISSYLAVSWIQIQLVLWIRIQTGKNGPQKSEEISSSDPGSPGTGYRIPRHRVPDPQQN